MQYGLYIPNFKCFGEARTVAELAQAAESAGWDGIFIWDHVSRRPEMGAVVDPWIALTAVAMVTERLRFGAMVTPVPRRRPWKLARETVSLDRLSNGRLVFGAGIGSGRGMEWDALGEETDPRVRGAMLDEGLEIIAGLWSGEPYQYHGAYYDVAEGHFQPGPTQTPRIPVWIGGNWPNKAPFRRAARWDGVFPIFKHDDDADNVNDFTALVAFINGERESDSGFDFVYRGNPATHIDVIRAYRDAGATWWLSALTPHYFGTTWDENWDCDAMWAAVRQGPPRV